jgi:hypothetical protein
VFMGLSDALAEQLWLSLGVAAVILVAFALFRRKA